MQRLKLVKKFLLNFLNILIWYLVFRYMKNFFDNLKRDYLSVNSIESDLDNKIVNPHNFDFTINPGEKVCDENQGQNVLVLCMVAISVEKFEERQTIRQTWADQNVFPKIKLIFLTGLSSDINLNLNLKQENEIYQDIVQENFLDTYANLTIKTIMGFKWVSLYCANSKFTLKIDHDIVVNTPVFIKYLEKS